MNLHAALIHYPIINKRKDIVCTSVTNLDIHDFGRIATTYGLQRVWIVHPYEGQKRFVRRVLKHWRDGWGGTYNPRRKESLTRIELTDDIASMTLEIERLYGETPVLVGTSAQRTINTVEYSEVRRWLHEKPDRPTCIVFGTGWGMHEEAMEQFDYMLPPIDGPTQWNHLSVRAAAAIIMDRLAAPER